MNKSIRRVTVFAGLMILALLVNITFSYAYRTESLTENVENRRVREAQFNQPRGAILVGNTPVVQTIPAQGRFNSQRSYADGPLYAQVSGYFSFIYGNSHLELLYNQELAGTADAKGDFINSLTGEYPEGSNIQTTLDAEAQQAAWDGLGDSRGAVVAVDYTTGAILAYVSKPSYDPAPLSGNDMDAVEAAWKQLIEDPMGSGKDRAGFEIYPPGSTFKLIVASAALQNGYSMDSVVDSPATLTLPGTNTVLHNSSNCGGEQITIAQALRVSCNTAFANLGLALGADVLRAQAEAYGFNHQFGADVNSSKSVFPAVLDPAQTALSSIGQFEVAASPLQMAMVSAAIANDGVQMEPHFVSEVRGADLSLQYSYETKALGTPITAKAAAELQQMMFAVVQSGTGTKAKVPGLTIGGKTGTADSDGTRQAYSWFTGFATDPKVAIAVITEDNKTSASVFAKVMETFK